ncbi:MAG: DNA-processing protein DprA [Patescibacteria group bacterium]
MTETEKIYLNAFNTMILVGPTRLAQIIKYFPDMKTAWDAPAGEFEKIFPDSKIARSIAEARNKVNPEKEFEKLEKENIMIITINDKEYPKLLKEIYTPPPMLYIKGLFNENDICIGVVGTRRMTLYGKEVAIDISAGLAVAGVTIVSGLAKGIDSVAHKTALENNARTIAVLGSSLDKNSIYPPQNKNLAEKICQNGAIISEYPIGMPALPQNFPQRNRIISGLSLGVLIVEAKEKSGALITANNAIEQNREVFAVPGPITSLNSVGPNNLIKTGAKAVTCANDILEELNLEKIAEHKEIKKIIPDSEEEAIILKLLSKEPTHIDRLVEKSNINASKINSTLIVMEMKGMVRNLGRMNYIIN